jgi:hypothetical protein
MKVQFPRWIKFGRRGSYGLYYGRLWKASDHLLLVKELGWTDEYKRFYFRDIQAFTLVRNQQYSFWVVMNIIIIIVSLLRASGNEFALSGSTMSALGFFVILLVHVLQGPTCSCWVQTGINHEKLPMFRRVRYARKMIAKLQEDIEEAQGVFSVDEMVAANGQPIKTPAADPAVLDVSDSET